MSGASESAASAAAAAAAMANRELFSLNPAPPAINVPQFDQQMNLYNPNGAAGFRSPPYQSMPTGTTSMTTPMNSNSNSTDQKRKRGRPRKYGPDGNMTIPMASQQQPMPINVAMPQQQTQIFSPPAAAPPTSAVQTETNPPIDGSVSPTFKKRGRPRGSKNKRQHNEASAVAGSNGIGFVPHVLNVNAGEDVSSKIMAICQNGPRAICVLSASGTIKTVTLRQTATSGGTATYEGQFDILSLSGSFMLTEVEGQKTRTGGLSVALAGRDGSVLGGSVAGLLIAASPVQIIVGSFMPDGQNYVEPSSGQLKVNAGGASSSPSRGTLSESSGGGPASPLNLSSGAFNQGMSGLPWK